MEVDVEEFAQGFAEGIEVVVPEASVGGNSGDSGVNAGTLGAEQRVRSNRAGMLERLLKPLPEDDVWVASCLQSEREPELEKYYGGMVSEWNPCFTSGGRLRVGCLEEDSELICGVCEDVGEGGEDHVVLLDRASPARSHLRALLEQVLDSQAGSSDVDLRPIRQLLGCLVQSGGRHTLHGMDAPVLGKHPCARGKVGKCVCRYGAPWSRLPRRVDRGCCLVADEKYSSHSLCFPRNDELCNSFEAHVLLANQGNVDWRPCANVYAVIEYILKYATKAPEGSRGLGQVLRSAVDEVCKYHSDCGQSEMLRRSLQKVFAKTLGERDYGMFEAVHLGLGLPLVFPLADVVSLNTSGARRMKQRREMQRDFGEGDVVTWDSKVDKFNERGEGGCRCGAVGSRAVRVVVRVLHEVLFQGESYPQVFDIAVSYGDSSVWCSVR